VFCSSISSPITALIKINPSRNSYLITPLCSAAKPAIAAQIPDGAGLLGRRYLA